ncbi:MAG: ABC transporter ATP-binding protein [Candidatus Heimdallarchaeota archaeon]|nr:MAG: ABC transporter ATP-binding protein [Candidatus Heimdallarchaeota archaeon]
MKGTDPNDSLIRVKGLCVYFFTEEGVVKAVEGIDLDINRGETLGLIGESGSGKSVSALSMLQLLPVPPAKIMSGAVYFEDRDLLKLSDEEMRKIRGGKISMIFQDPMTSLNPLYSVTDQIGENLRVHRNMDPEEAIEEAINMMKVVGIPDAEKRAKDFPHQFSGGMRQRIMIAIALSCRPALLIADEPTTALDVTIQAQVLNLIEELKQKYQTSVLYITHNFAVVAEIADRLAVMYAGYIVEEHSCLECFENPAHPYTKDLLSSIPRVDRKLTHLEVIRGSIPNLINPPSGCRFHPRCKKVMDICSKEVPERIEIGPRHFVRCHLYS